MKILKYKKVSKNKYKIFLDNDSNITLYEDVIINNNLLIKKEVSSEELLNIEKENNNISTYEIALNYIEIKMRSIKEIKDYLKKKNIDSKLIDIAVNKLIKNGYLNYYLYAKAFVNDEFNLTNKGPLKIKKELKKHDIKDDVINELISNIDYKDILNKLDKLINKMLKIKKGGVNSIKIKIVNYFINLGYEKGMILDALDNYIITSDVSILKKEYNKLYSKYSKKYDGEYLNYFVSSKLLQKGYTKEEINNVINNN